MQLNPALPRSLGRRPARRRAISSRPTSCSPEGGGSGRAPLGLAALAALAFAGCAATQPTTVKRAQAPPGADPVLFELVRKEQFNQRLEHDMVDMQVAAFKGQMQNVAAFWHPTRLQATPFPSRHGDAPRPVSAGHGSLITEGGWVLDGTARAMTPAAISESMEGFL